MNNRVVFLAENYSNENPSLDQPISFDDSVDLNTPYDCTLFDCNDSLDFLTFPDSPRVNDSMSSLLLPDLDSAELQTALSSEVPSPDFVTLSSESSSPVSYIALPPLVNNELAVSDFQTDSSESALHREVALPEQVVYGMAVQTSGPRSLSQENLVPVNGENGAVPWNSGLSSSMNWFSEQTCKMR